MILCGARMRFARERGFGLLEALVSLVLISSVGFTLLAWVQQSLDATQRIRGHYREQELRRAVLDWSETMNPMPSRSGGFVHGAYRIAWHSEQQGDKVPQSGYPAGVGLYDIALFRVEVDVSEVDDNRKVFQMVVTRVGYQKARARGGFFGE